MITKEVKEALNDLWRNSQFLSRDLKPQQTSPETGKTISEQLNVIKKRLEMLERLQEIVRYYKVDLLEVYNASRPEDYNDYFGESCGYLSDEDFYLLKEIQDEAFSEHD